MHCIFVLPDTVNPTVTVPGQENKRIKQNRIKENRWISKVL